MPAEELHRGHAAPLGGRALLTIVLSRGPGGGRDGGKGRSGQRHNSLRGAGQKAFERFPSGLSLQRPLCKGLFAKASLPFCPGAGGESSPFV